MRPLKAAPLLLTRCRRRRRRRCRSRAQVVRDTLRIMDVQQLNAHHTDTCVAYA